MLKSLDLPPDADSSMSKATVETISRLVDGMLTGYSEEELPKRFYDKNYGPVDQGNINGQNKNSVPGLTPRRVASNDPNAGFVETTAGHGGKATPSQSVPIVGSTKGSASKALAALQAVQASFGQPITVTRGASRTKANPGGTHAYEGGKSDHDHGLAFDVDISGMSDGERLQLLNAAKKAGFYDFGFGTGILHVGMSGAPRAWTYYGPGKPNGIGGSRAIVKGTKWAGADMAALQADVVSSPRKALAASFNVPEMKAAGNDAGGDVSAALASSDGPRLGNPRLPITMAADAERQAAAEAVAKAGGSKPTLTVADMNAEPAPAAYASERDRVFNEQFSQTPWEKLPAEARDALTSRLGDKAPQAYEAARAAAGQGAAGGGEPVNPPAQVASLEPNVPTPRLRPDAPVGAVGSGLSERDLDIGARIMSGEAANQGEQGRQAVAEVLLNRAAAGYNGKTTVADVALDGNGAQFNAAKGGGNKPYRNPGAQYEENKRILQELADGKRDRLLPDGTDSFHGKGKAEKGGQVLGDHVFYSSGGAGTPRLTREASLAPVAEQPQAAGKYPGGPPPVLRIGSGKPDAPDPHVAFLQQKLKDQNPLALADFPVDGVFGPQTRIAVAAFNKRTGDKSDKLDVAGPHTWGTLAKMAPEEGFGPFPRLRPDTTAAVDGADQASYMHQPPAIGAGIPSEVAALARVVDPASVGRTGLNDLRTVVKGMADLGSADVPRITARRPPDLLMSLADQTGGNKVNRAAKGDRERQAFPNIITDFPGFVRRSMEVAMPDVQSIPMALRGGVPGGPSVPPAPQVAQPAPPPSPAPREDPGIGSRASGLLTVIRQMLAGGGIASPETMGLPTATPAPRIQPAVVAPSGGMPAYATPYDPEPADRRSREAADMAFGSGAAATLPGATFSESTPQRTASSDGSAGGGASATSGASGGGSSGGRTSSGPGTNNPNSIEQAISALQHAIDSMATFTTGSNGQIVGGI